MDAGFFNMCKLINMTHHIKRLRNKTYMVTIIDEENIFLFYLNSRNCLERTLIDENSYLNDPRNQNYRTLLILCRNLLILCWNRKWKPTPVLLPEKSLGGGSVVGYSPWDHKESDTTEQLHFHTSCVVLF